MWNEVRRLLLLSLARWEAGRRLALSDQTSIAFEAMRKLNAHARTQGYKRVHPAISIYAVKDRFITAMCITPFLRDVLLDEQVMKCWECDGTGITWWSWYGEPTTSERCWKWTSERCWKCGGTGVYRSIPLLEFHFTVNGRAYVLHQPKALSTYGGEVHMGSRIIGTIAGDVRDRLRTIEIEVLLEVVRQYLGERLERLFWKRAFRDDWRAIRYNVRNWFRGKWYDLRRVDEEEEIPF